MLTVNVPVTFVPLPEDVAYTDANNFFSGTQHIQQDTHLTNVGAGFITITNDSGTIVLQPEYPYVYVIDPAQLNIGTTDTQLSLTLGTTASGSDVSNNTYLASNKIYYYNTTNKATNIHQDNDGSIRIQTAPTGTAFTAITWLDKMVIGNTGSLSLPSIATTTTAPSAGGADALPATPTGYVTITLNGVERKIAYY